MLVWKQGGWGVVGELGVEVVVTECLQEGAVVPSVSDSFSVVSQIISPPYLGEDELCIVKRPDFWY